jgi:1-deoxy-D-xylulose-5-phosphate synthase
MNHSVGLPDQAARVSTLPVRTKSAADTIRSSGENVSALAISHISCHYLLRQIRSAAGPAGAICRSPLCGFLPFAAHPQATNVSGTPPKTASVRTGQSRRGLTTSRTGRVAVERPALNDPCAVVAEGAKDGSLLRAAACSERPGGCVPSASWGAQEATVQVSGLESIHNRHAHAQNGRGSGLVVPVPSCSSDAPGSRTVPAVNEDATEGGTVDLAGLTPAALQQMTSEELSSLATDIRRYLVDTVSRTGGHLGPNLGVVELTLALHRVFDSPRIPIIFDVGHQCYVHKLVTGRGGDLARLRTAGGPSGYPNRAESVHDLVENSHASAALGYADGLSRAFELAGQQRPVVVVVGDGALTGGPAWEALNNLSTARRPVVIVLNDNGDSYAPTVGGLSDHLRRLAARGGLQDLVEQLGGASVPVEPAQFDTWFGMLGLDALESAFRQVADTKTPIVVHCLTRKGRGHPPAEADQIDHMHTMPAAARPGQPQVGARAGLDKGPAATWTDVFADSLVELAARRSDLVGITAAMAGPTGLRKMAVRYPSRVVDVGIAEADAVLVAAGLAMGGAHPVVAIYATFANRAFDQALLDVALHDLPVTFVLDRAGITGPDGPSHHGMWDLALFSLMPGMSVAAPRDAAQLDLLLTEAVERSGPSMIRFPKGKVEEPIIAVARWADFDVLRTASSADVLIIAIGAVARAAVEAANLLSVQGIDCTVVDPRWALPVSPHLPAIARAHRAVFTVEDGLRRGGAGTQIAQALLDAGVGIPIRVLGLPTEFVPHGDRATLLQAYGLDAAGIAATVAEAIQRPSLVANGGNGRKSRLTAALVKGH